MCRRSLQSILLGLILFSTIKAQTGLQSSNYKIDLGYGNSTYKNIKTQQYLFFYKIPNLEWRNKNFGFDTDINFELIKENNKSTYILGLVPMLRYDFNLLDKDIFLKGGIGANYINNHNIGNRNTGSHFIFSDMISIGMGIYESPLYNIEISYLFRHISNAGFYKNNEGFNSQYLIISLDI